jgi:hypothetical protein
MKYYFLLVLLYCFVFGCKKDDIDPTFESECYPTNLSAGVIASYSFSHGSLKNETSISADLVNVGGALPTTDRNGNLDCAYVIIQTQGEQFLTTANSSFLNGLNQFSISLWYQPIDSTRDAGDYEVLVGRNSLEDQNHCPDRYGEWSVGLFDCRKAVFGHNNSVWTTTPDSIGCEENVWNVTGVWKHVVAVYNNNNYRIYQNGIIEDSVSGIGGCSHPYSAQDIGDLFIGKFYKGKIDDILIYNREITPEEVAELYALQPCCLP